MEGFFSPQIQIHKIWIPYPFQFSTAIKTKILNPYPTELEYSMGILFPSTPLKLIVNKENQFGPKTYSERESNFVFH
jgi:hypothetical protein